MIRGDDDIFAVMNEMSSSGDKSSSIDLCRPIEQTDNIPQYRLLPEVEGYGDSTKFYLPENGFEGNIWNPLVCVKLSFNQATKSRNAIFPPTNPYVEVSRRRAYEKFKDQFYSAFNLIANDFGPNINNPSISTSTRKNDQNINLADLSAVWKKIPAHSILERWHFACKLEESLQVIENLRMSNDERNSRIKYDDGINSENIRRIYSLLSSQKESGTLMDPMLLTILPSRIVEKNSIAKNNGQESVRPTMQQLLKNEIKFQFRREWKQTKTAKKHDDADERALQEFFNSSKFNKRCSRIARSVVDIALKIDSDFLNDLDKKASALETSSSSWRKGGRNKNIPKMAHESRDMGGSEGVVKSVSMSYSGLSFSINETHFKKLQILFDRNNAKNATSMSSHLESFSVALFRLLARYDMLAGAGLQSSLTGNVFDSLLKYFQCNMECFASPLNCRYERFFSAFPDVDTAFGSMGSFFDFDFNSLTEGGCFQANPPFGEDFILSMNRRMEQLLSNSSMKAPLMFIVFIPAWRESSGWKAISESPNLVHHLLLSQKETPHYYCEGTQHRRMKGRYRIASFETSVFFLQNDEAKKKWNVTEEALSDLQHAFCFNPDDEQHDSKWSKKDNVAHGKVRKPVGINTTLNNAVSSNKKKRKKNSQNEAKQNSNANNTRQHESKRQKKKKKQRKLVSDDNAKQQMDILRSLTAFGGSDGGSKQNKGKKR